MPKTKDSHVSAQVAGGVVIGQHQNLDSLLKGQDYQFNQALNEVNKVRAFVGQPQNILGSSSTKHGEIAEQVDVCIHNARRVLEGNNPNAYLDPNRIGPIDYHVDSVAIQSKYINGLNNTLDHVKDHITKYPNFPEEGVYRIPKDFLSQLKELQSTGRIDGLSPRSVRAIETKLAEITEMTGRTPSELIQAGEATYGEVQLGKVSETLDHKETELNARNEDIKSEIKSEAGPSVSGALEAGIAGAAAGAGVQIAGTLWQKWKHEGKNPFKGEFTREDWSELGLNVASGAGVGAVSGASVYALTSSTGLAAPIAGAVVSGVIGIVNLNQQFQSGAISKAQFVDMSLTIAAESSIVGITTLAAQAIIPIPILGAFIGSIAGKFIASALSKYYSGKTSAIAKVLHDYEQEMMSKLNTSMKAMLERVNHYFDNIDRLLDLAFDATANTELRLRHSVNLARAMKVSDDKIIRSTKDLDDFMLN